MLSLLGRRLHEFWFFSLGVLIPKGRRSREGYYPNEHVVAKGDDETINEEAKGAEISPTFDFREEANVFAYSSWQSKRFSTSDLETMREKTTTMTLLYLRSRDNRLHRRVA